MTTPPLMVTPLKCPRYGAFFIKEAHTFLFGMGKGSKP